MMPTSSALLRRVRLHQRGLFFRQPPFLPKKWRKLFVNLSNIVQQCSGFDLFNLLGRQAQLDRDRPGKFAHADGMAGGVWISSFDGLHHQLEELLATVLELVVQAVHMPNRHDRNYYADKADGPEAEPMSNRRVEPRYEHRDHARANIVAQHATRIEVPHLSE